MWTQLSDWAFLLLKVWPLEHMWFSVFQLSKCFVTLQSCFFLTGTIFSMYCRKCDVLVLYWRLPILMWLLKNRFHKQEMYKHCRMYSCSSFRCYNLLTRTILWLSIPHELFERTWSYVLLYRLVLHPRVPQKRSQPMQQALHKKAKAVTVCNQADEEYWWMYGDTRCI